MSWVPLPWCASKSTINTRSPASANAAAATATLENKQKPIVSDLVAWWPGGRTAQNAESASPFCKARIAVSPAPAASNAAFHEPTDARVSGSSLPPPD